MNPMMNPPPKGAPGPENEHLYPPPGMNLPPFPYPPFPMMYPPPPEAFFRFHEPKNPKDAHELAPEPSVRERAEAIL